MRSFVWSLLLLVSLCVLAEEPVPKELQGYWVPTASSCKSTLGVLVAASSVEFRGPRKKQAVPTQTCFTCEGGARYSGIVIWVLPAALTQDEFTLHLNSGERKGVAKVEFENPERWSSFPIHNVDLKRCEI